MVTLPTVGLEAQQESTEQIRLFTLCMDVDNKLSFLSQNCRVAALCGGIL